MKPLTRVLIILGLLLAGMGILPGAAAPDDTGATYVILMHGDGMGPEHVKAGGMYLYGAAGTLPFEAFPNQTTMTHNNASNTTTDSAASATAMATGVKVNNGVISVRTPGDGSELPSLLEAHRDSGNSTGLVTESYLTDASPAAHGAHESSRYNYSAIFTDFVAQSRPNVLLGGGGSTYGFNSTTAANNGYAVVTTRAALLARHRDGDPRGRRLRQRPDPAAGQGRPQRHPAEPVGDGRDGPQDPRQ